MGYFVQISNDIGRPVFQAAKNYPDVSFASSALFHALVTASLKAGFVPSVLRAEDATVALAVHGPAGGRVVIALVTSELAAGQTKDLEAKLHWRLNIIYRGALLAVGGDMLRQQPAELQRILGQRLAPIVQHVMTEETAAGLSGKVPQLGLTLCGAAVEWLNRSRATDASLEQLAAIIGRDSDTTDVAAVLSWQGRALTATSAWRRLASVDQSLLLALAEQVGPATFDQPARSWAFEDVERLWLPSAAAASLHVTDAGGEPGDCALTPLGMQQNYFGQSPTTSDTLSAAGVQRYRMISVRLYPPKEVAETHGMGGRECEACLSPMGTAHRWGTQIAHGAVLAPDEEALPLLLGAHATSSAVLGVCEEECSLVLSVLQRENDGAHVYSAADLDQSVAGCSGESFRDMWPTLCPIRRVGQQISRNCEGLFAAVLLDEGNQDVIMLPSPRHRCEGLPWKSAERRCRSTAARRIIYWIHALPPLGCQRTQQYVCCEGYAIGAMRRGDGIHCWALMESPLVQEASRSVEEKEGKHDGRCGGEVDDNGGDCRILAVVAEILEHVPRPANFGEADGGGLGAEDLLARCWAAAEARYGH